IDAMRRYGVFTAVPGKEEHLITFCLSHQRADHPVGRLHPDFFNLCKHFQVIDPGSADNSDLHSLRSYLRILPVFSCSPFNCRLIRDSIFSGKGMKGGVSSSFPSSASLRHSSPAKESSRFG